MIFPVDEIMKKYGNKYESIIIASKEARRINSLRLAAGGAPEGAVKSSVEALRRASEGLVQWKYAERASRGFEADEEL